MKLVVQELQTGGNISQGIVPSKNTIVVAVRPHIYRHNFATGTLKVEIYDQSSTLVAESNEISINDIGTKSFFHGYVRFDINTYLTAGQTYTLKLVGSADYSFDESAYCGWVNGLDLGKYPIIGNPASSYNYPFDYEVWEKTVR